MLQVQCDWSYTGTVKQLEYELSDFKFKGPGWYLSSTDSLLLLPVIEPKDHELTYLSDWPPGQYFTVYVFNCPFDKTVFGYSTLPPIRVDTRPNLFEVEANNEVLFEVEADSEKEALLKAVKSKDPRLFINSEQGQQVKQLTARRKQRDPDTTRL